MPTVEELVEARRNVTTKDFKPPRWQFEAVVGLGTGLICARLGPYVLRKPPLSALPVFLSLPVVGYYVGEYVAQFRIYKQAKRDLELKTYIERFPERFPELSLEVKTYNDVLDYWQPKRFS